MLISSLKISPIPREMGGDELTHLLNKMADALQTMIQNAFS